MATSAASAGARRPTPRAPALRALRAALTGWAFSAPFVLIFAVFLALPILASLVLSFTSFGLADLQKPFGAQFVGLDNYSTLIHDEEFRTTVWNTVVYVALGVPLTIIVGLAVAVGLNHAALRLKGLFRAAYYLPVVTSIVALAVIWRFVYNPEVGVLNVLLGQLGISGPNWLGDTAWAKLSILAVIVWRNFGMDAVIFLAALQGVSAVLYEAARIDGATSWQIFRKITVPLLRPAILFLTVITTVGYLQVFEEPFVMTKGGPLNSTESVSMLVYKQGFNFFHLGYASAVAYTLFLAIVVLAVIQFRLLRPQT